MIPLPGAQVQVIQDLVQYPAVQLRLVQMCLAELVTPTQPIPPVLGLPLVPTLQWWSISKSMKTWMEAVEERLNILTPNPELEADWDELQELGERYRALERKCKEKAQMWAALKRVQPKQP